MKTTSDDSGGVTLPTVYPHEVSLGLEGLDAAAESHVHHLDQGYTFLNKGDHPLGEPA